MPWQRHWRPDRRSCSRPAGGGHEHLVLHGHAAGAVSAHRGSCLGACVNRGQVGYLSIAVDADPADMRTDQIPGDVTIAGRTQPGWGLHLADMNLALGDLIALVEAQTEGFNRR